MNKSPDCIVCTDKQYNKPGPAYICDICANDPTLVISNPVSLNLTLGCCAPITNVPYCPTRSIYPIDKYLDACLLLFKDHPGKIKKINKCKDQWLINRKIKVDNDIKKDQLLNNLKLSSNKFNYKIDFDTNSVKDIINKQIEKMGITDQNLMTVIINDLYNYSIIMLNKDNTDKFILDRTDILDKTINDNMCGCYEPELTKVRNQIKNYPAVKTMYTEFCVNDKGDIQNIKRNLYLLVSSISRTYNKAREYVGELATYGIEL